MSFQTRRYLIYALTLFGIFIWLSAIFLAPYLKSRHSVWNVLLYAVFSSVCHQIPGRSFHIFGFPLAVCARCFGIYFGFFLGTLAFPAFRRFSSVSLPKNIVFIFFSLPIVADTIGNFFHFWQSSNVLRFFIGISWGIILPVYFLAGLFIAFERKKHLNLERKNIE
ncbi:MAG: DUF2085 domain-containing protein [Candidatus Aminicenantes bacterium]|nr:DUF2085 domain-containing protein [Candidatus Aminicenantes bacterium]